MGIGYIMDGVKMDKVNYLETKESFVIQYNNRRIVVTPSSNTRLCTYRWKGKIETITFPTIVGVNPLEQVEHFMSRYKTSRLSKCLFNFSNMKNPTDLIAFDPVNGKLLSEIQLKLKSFIRNS
jgi:hypothetical protein